MKTFGYCESQNIWDQKSKQNIIIVWTIAADYLPLKIEQAVNCFSQFRSLNFFHVFLGKTAWYTAWDIFK